jgi:hypothetical protein
MARRKLSEKFKKLLKRPKAISTSDAGRLFEGDKDLKTKIDKIKNDLQGGNGRGMDDLDDHPLRKR